MFSRGLQQVEETRLVFGADQINPERPDGNKIEFSVDLQNVIDDQ